MRWFHIHRYVWGKPYNERWVRSWRGRESDYTRTFQEGTCSCGSTKVKEL